MGEWWGMVKSLISTAVGKISIAFPGILSRSAAIERTSAISIQASC